MVSVQWETLWGMFYMTSGKNLGRVKPNNQTMSKLSIARDSVQLISYCWCNVPVNYCICSPAKQIISVLFIHTSATFSSWLIGVLQPS